MDGGARSSILCVTVDGEGEAKSGVVSRATEGAIADVRVSSKSLCNGREKQYQTESNTVIM